ncbi:hypothetical protein ACSBR2_031290 [Camellia fascicularis]
MSGLIRKSLHHLRSAIRASSPTHHHNLYFLQIHRSFSSSSIEATPNQHSFTVNYLINSCGLPLEKALSLSKQVKFETPHKPDSVLALFENHGFTKTQISNLVMKFPRVLLCDPDKTLLPKLEFFKSKGVSSTDVAKMLSSAPKVLDRSLRNQIIPSFNFYRNLIQSQDETILAIKRCCWLLLLDPEACEPDIEFLREVGMPNEKNFILLRYICRSRGFMSNVVTFRRIVEEVEKMGFNPCKLNFVLAIHVLKSISKSTCRKKVEVYKKWGWSEDEILEAFGKHPVFMTVSENKIMRVMDFFVNKIGWETPRVYDSV